MNAQAYRLKDAQLAAHICIKAMHYYSDDLVAFWARVAARAALNYLSVLADFQDCDLEMVSLAIAALAID